MEKKSVQEVVQALRTLRLQEANNLSGKLESALLAAETSTALKEDESQSLNTREHKRSTDKIAKGDQTLAM